MDKQRVKKREQIQAYMMEKAVEKQKKQVAVDTVSFSYIT